MIGRTISHYRVVSQLGAGGMGVVYGGDDTRLGRPVALKFVPEELAKDLLAMERFRIEARTASALNHANICTIYDIGESEGRPYIVMEWMKGQTLQDRLVRGLLKVHQIVDVGIQVADALEAAHAQGIVHRDIKPANIFLTERGQVKVMDFGLAKLLSARDANTTTATIEALTSPGTTLGTVSYMSPEQAVGDEVDVRSDLFSLGVVLYECATGHRPFTGNSTGAILVAILNKSPVAPVVFNPDMPLRLQEVINNCLEKDPDLRYQNAADLRADLKRVKRDLESGRTAAVVPTSSRRSRAAAAAGDSGSGSVMTHGDTPPAPSAAPSSPAVASVASSGGNLRLIAAVIAAVAIGAAGASYFLLPGVPTSTTTGGAADPSAALVQDRAAQAARSLQDRQYRAALASAEEVLAAVPDHAGARAIRDQAGTMLRRFDAAIADARAAAKAGDARGATRLLDEARAIDSAGPGIADVSVLLAGEFKGQAEAARQELQRSRAAVVAPSLPLRSPTRSEPVLHQAPSDVTPQSAPARPPATPVNPPASEPPLPAVKPTPSQAPAAAERREQAPAVAATSPVEDDESAIRRVVAVYARALETKDLALFRSVKPNLAAEEERRIQQGFRAVASQQVSITILSIERRGEQASVRLRRRDVIEAGGRRQAPESQQTMTLAKANGNWVIVEIGR